MKYYVLPVVFMFIMLSSFTSAVPQVFFTYVNLTINATAGNSSYHLWGEGLNAVDTFTGAYYEKYQIPITISRDLQANETDAAVLIRAIATNLNMSNKWEDCIARFNEVSTNYSICEADRGYKENFTVCSNQLTICNLNVQTLQTQLQTTSSQLDDVKTHRMILIVVAGILAFVAWTYYNKVKIKKIDSPYSALPQGMRT